MQRLNILARPFAPRNIATRARNIATRPHTVHASTSIDPVFIVTETAKLFALGVGIYSTLNWIMYRRASEKKHK